MKQKLKSWMPLIVLIIGLFALRWTVVEPYVVPTGSMEPTLKPGDRLYALKCAYHVKFPFRDWILFNTGKIKRGDVILFRAPQQPSVTYVKRVVGLPGDRLEFQEGKLLVNGQVMPAEPAPQAKQIMSDLKRADQRSLYIETLTGLKHYMVLDDYYGMYRTLPPFTVPEGNLFAVGDNRDNSHDSRAWGFVPIEYLKGQAMFIWYSSEHEHGLSFLDNLKLALTRPRAERVGMLIQ